MSRLHDGPDTKPDQIESAEQLERRKKLRAGKNDRRDAKAASDNVNEST
jgi:hypothetical protein